jgi:hypothetical protein
MMMIDSALLKSTEPISEITYIAFSNAMSTHPKVIVATESFRSHSTYLPYPFLTFGSLTSYQHTKAEPSIFMCSNASPNVGVVIVPLPQTPSPHFAIPNSWTN